jgi:hypothetical protein
LTNLKHFAVNSDRKGPQSWLVEPSEATLRRSAFAHEKPDEDRGKTQMNRRLTIFSARLYRLTIDLAFGRLRKNKRAQILLNDSVESDDRSPKPLVGVPLF